MTAPQSSNSPNLSHATLSTVQIHTLRAELQNLSPKPSQQSKSTRSGKSFKPLSSRSTYASIRTSLSAAEPKPSMERA